MTHQAGPAGLFRKRVKALTKHATRIDEGDVEAVHRTRVTTRRLRELLPVLRLDSAAVGKLGRRLKKATKRLGDVRDLDVMLQMARELSLDSRYSATALRQVAATVGNERVAARDRLVAKLSFEKIQRLAGRLKRAVKKRASKEDGNHTGGQASKRAWVWAVEARAVRRARDVRGAIETAGTVYVAERLHEVRIAVKKLRYAMEVATELRSGQRDSPDVSVLKTAQGSLGRLHDLEVLVERARDEQVRLSPPNLSAWRELDELIQALEDDCRAIHAHYLQGRSKLMAIADRVYDTKGHSVFGRRRAAG